MRRLMLLLGLITVAARAQPADPPQPPDPIAGHWQGVLERGGAALPVAFDFTHDAGEWHGRFTSEQQRAMDFPLDAVTRDGMKLGFVLGGDMRFQGVLSDVGIAGSFHDGDGDGQFRLERAPAPRLPYTVSAVTFANGAVRLSGSVVAPRDGGRHPAMLLLQGSGPETRWGTNRFIADRMARLGIVTLIYDKRGSGESGGDWKTADYDDLARDALAGVALLRARGDVDPARIGLLGHSQGGIVAADAVRLAPAAAAFVVAEDTVVGPVWEQDVYRVRGALATDYPPDQAAAAMRLYRLFIDVARGVRPMAELDTARAAATGAPWLDWLDLPPRDSWLWAWYARTGTVDTRDYWRGVRVPVLLVYGERDRIVPVDESIARLDALLGGAGVPHTALIAPRAEHNLTVHPQPGEPFFWWHAAPGLIDTVAAWIAAQPARRG